MITLEPLPKTARDLLDSQQVPPRLLIHLRLVHDTARKLVVNIQLHWQLNLNEEAIYFGAATHDIGKILHPEELTSEGHRHEEAGYHFLLENGIKAELARFAKTHGNWQEVSSLEDLIVALADKIWKGERINELEMKVAQQIADTMQEPLWQVYMQLDDILTLLSIDADSRLAMQHQ